MAAALHSEVAPVAATAQMRVAIGFECQELAVVTELEPNLPGLGGIHLEVAPVTAASFCGASASRCIEECVGASILEHDEARVPFCGDDIEPTPVASSASCIEGIFAFDANE